MTDSTKIAPTAKRQPRLGYLFGPGLTILSLITLLAAHAAADTKANVPYFALSLAATAVAWIGFMAYLTARCIVRQVSARIDRQSKLALKAVRENRIIFLQHVAADQSVGHLRSVN